MQYMPYIWLAVIVLCLIVEAVTAQMVSIWFGGGGLVAFLISLIAPNNLALQLVFFFIISVLILIAMRPIVKRTLDTKKVHTNADRVIGQTAVVLEEINNMLGCGTANVSGQVWTARSVDGTVIPAGTTVRVQSIQGVKLMVLPLQHAAE